MVATPEQPSPNPGQWPRLYSCMVLALSGDFSLECLYTLEIFYIHWKFTTFRV